jgi:short-subunit dehydrogenase
MAHWTLITGASEGLGVEFAKLAARENRNLILTARSTDKLEAVAKTHRTAGRDVVVIPADLSIPEEVEHLWSEATQGRTIDVLVNNAGLGAYGPFSDDRQWPRERTSMSVNIDALTYLMKQAIPHMQDAGGGRILNVSSLGGFLPGPECAVYCATKAYVLSLSEAVASELKGSGVTVSAICPGVTATNFHNDANMHGLRLFKMGAPMDAFKVAEEGWLEARIGKRVIVPGLSNKLSALMPRMVPRSLTTALAGYLMGKS